MTEPTPVLSEQCGSASSGLTAPGGPSSDAETLEGLLRERYSCRSFRPDPVPDEVLDRVLHMAQRTASWCNSQAWQVTLVSGEATRDFAAFLLDWVSAHPSVSDFPAPERYDGVYGERRRAAGYGLYAALGIERSDHGARTRQMLENFRFFGAPHVAVITSDSALGVYGAVDCGGYVATLLTAARSLGIDSCAQASLALYSDGVREHLDLADDRSVVCGVALGYAESGHPANDFRTGREGLSAVVDRRA